MTHVGVQPLKQILRMARETWDRDDTRPAVREAFAKVLACGTAALGAEVFTSTNEERIVYHTCKSRACPSCGHQATRAWQRDLWRELPDLPYAHLCLTMPDVLWPLFRRNRHLCSAPGFLDSGLTVFASTLPRPARRGHVAPERDFDSGISPASTARCTFA